MNFSRFFVDRPIFAAVLSIVITLVGALAYFGLPISQYPEIVPPTVVVTATYPGADARTLAETVATPLEQEINGVEDMLYLSSSSTSDGRVQITVTFKLGTDLDKAQVLVQNKINSAIARLPEEVRRLGVTAQKRSPDLTLAAQFYSPDGSREVGYLSNYVTLQIQNEIARLPGVAEASSLGGLDYSMRVWLDPEKVAALGLTAGDIVQAIREQNVQVAAGSLGQPPAPVGAQFQYTLTAPGRLKTAEQFGGIVLKTGANGSVVRLTDVARIEIGSPPLVQRRRAACANRDAQDRREAEHGVNMTGRGQHPAQAGKDHQAHHPRFGQCEEIAPVRRQGNGRSSTVHRVSRPCRCKPKRGPAPASPRLISRRRSASRTGRTQ